VLQFICGSIHTSIASGDGAWNRDDEEKGGTAEKTNATQIVKFAVSANDEAAFVPR